MRLRQQSAAARQVPIHLGQKWGSGYRRTTEDIHKGYIEMPSTPLFAFGHGLSYTTFEYSPLELVSDTVDVGGEARMSLTITNTGKRRGTEVVQLYAADTATGVTLPAQQLIGFARVDLEPGPVVLGHGKPYLAGPRPPLRLVARDRIGEDVIRLVYVPS